MAAQVVSLDFIAHEGSAKAAIQELVAEIKKLKAAGGNVEVKADTSKARTGFQQLAKSADDTHTKVKSLAKTLIGFGAAAVGIYGIEKAFHAALEETANFTKVQAQTQAVIKSTGGVAGVTAKHVEELGVQLLKISGVDDEVIKSGENMLLHFTKIRNVVGANNDIFDQATKAALDLSQGLGISMVAASKALGKALQEPATGMAGLQRAGIQFSAVQKQQIKDFIQHNDLLSAQKLILEQVTERYGGMAAAMGGTFTGRWNTFVELLKNAAAAVLTGLTPALTQLTDWLAKSADKLATFTESARGQEKIKEWANDVVNLSKAFFQLAKDVVSAVASIVGALSPVVSALGGLKNTLELMVTAWVAWKAAGIAAAVAVKVEQIAAAVAVGGAWDAALISTGFGALAVAAGIAAVAIIQHWSRVKAFLEDWRGALNALKVTMIEMGKGFVGWLLAPFAAAIDGALRLMAKLVDEANKIPIVGRAIPDGLAPSLKRAAQSIESFMKGLVPDVGKIGAAWQAVGQAAGKGYSAGFAAAMAANPINPLPAGLGGQAANIPAGTLSPIPAGANQGIIGTPGVGTHNQPDWQSGNAVDVKVAPGTAVLAPFDGVLEYHSGPSTPTQVGSKILFGDQGTLTAANGAQVFITHVNFVKSGAVKKGDIIAYALDAGSGTHVHIAEPRGQDPLALVNAKAGFAVSSPGGASVPSASTVGGVSAASTGAVAVKTKVKAAPTPADTAAVAQVKQSLVDLGKGIPEALDATAPALQKRLDGIRALMKKFAADGVITSSELATIKARMKSLSTDIGNSIDLENIREKLAGAKAKIAELFAGGFISEEQRNSLQASIAKISKMIREATDPDSPGGINITNAERAAIDASWKKVSASIAKGVADAAVAAAGIKQVKAMIKADLADGMISDEELAAIGNKLQGLKGKLAEGMRNAVTALQDARADFKASFDVFVNYALEAFDKAHAKMREALTVALTFDGVTVQMDANALTPTEQLLADRAKAAEEKRYQDAVDAARKQLALAQSSGGDIQAAQAALDQALYDQQTYYLQQKANAERTAANAALAAAQDNFDEQTKIQRQAFETQLRDIETQMANGKLTYGQGLEKIKALFQQYQVPFDQQGSALGEALQNAMLGAFTTLGTAMDKLATAMDNLVRIMGGQVTTLNQYAAQSAAAAAKIVASSGAQGTPAAQQAGNPALSPNNPNVPVNQYPVYNASGQLVSGGTSSSTTSSTTSSAPAAAAPAPAPAPVAAPVVSGTNAAGDPLRLKGIPEYADGGLSETRGLAWVSETGREAHVPVPDWLASEIKARFGTKGLSLQKFLQALFGSRLKHHGHWTPRTSGGDSGSTGSLGPLPDLPSFPMPAIPQPNTVYAAGAGGGTGWDSSGGQPPVTVIIQADNQGFADYLQTQVLAAAPRIVPAVSRQIGQMARDRALTLRT